LKNAKKLELQKSFRPAECLEQKKIINQKGWAG